MAVGRQNLALLKHIAPRVGYFDGHAARQGHVAFAVQQRLAGHVGGHQRCGTGRLHIDARPRQVEDEGRAGGQEILVIASMAQQEHAGGFNKVRVGTQVEIKIVAHAATGENPHRAGKVFGRVTGVFQRLPHDLKKLAMLRIHDRGLFWGKPKEFGVKGFKPVQGGGGGDVIGVVQQMGRLACGQ